MIMNVDEMKEDDRLFGDLTPLIDEMISNMHFVESIEKPLGYKVLKNGTKVQITVKLNSNEKQWI